jgi:hypothetical protein
MTPKKTLPKKKLIEVALPLEAINQASAREKSIRHGHPSTLHLWWARRPLAAAQLMAIVAEGENGRVYFATPRPSFPASVDSRVRGTPVS